MESSTTLKLNVKNQPINKRNPEELKNKQDEIATKLVHIHTFILLCKIYWLSHQVAEAANIHLGYSIICLSYQHGREEEIIQTGAQTHRRHTDSSCYNTVPSKGELRGSWNILATLQRGQKIAPWLKT